MTRIMTIFAHPDDETFSAGGVLAKYSEKGDAYALSVTSTNQRKKEFQNACSIIGCKSTALDYENIDKVNQNAIQKDLEDIIREIKPDIIITHLEFDYHKEHRLLQEIVKEAIEWVSHTTSNKPAHQVKSLWGAETTVLIPSPTLFIDITKQNHKRMEAIESYSSQIHKGGDNFYKQFHGTRTELRGIQAGVKNAEAFISIPIILSGAFKPVKAYEFLPE